MSGYGEIYVEVDASVANNGIMTLSTSGNINDGSGAEDSKYWLLWSYSVVGETVTGGFTGISWYYDDPNSYVLTGWSNSALGTPGKEGFEEYLKEHPNLTDLNAVLGEWPEDMKANFLESHKTDSAFANCYTFINPN